MINVTSMIFELDNCFMILFAKIFFLVKCEFDRNQILEDLVNLVR